MLKLTSRQLNQPIVIKPLASLVERIPLLDNENATKLNELTDEVSDYWSEQPGSDTLHIFVKLPDAGE